MKKKLCLAAILSMMMVVLAGCGKLNPDKYVTLGNYKDLSVDVTYVTFSEEDVQTCADNELGVYIQTYDLYDYEPIVSANTVEQGHIVNIDYEGKIDGQIFAGGSAQGAHLEIGSGQFIPGFEDGLVGKNVGENVELDLAFPEDYQNAEYAGKNVVFSVSINSIDKREMPEITDELIASLNMSEEITTYDAYLDYLRKYLQDTCDEQNETALQNAVWEAVYAVCEVSDPPQEMIDKQYADLEEYFRSYAEYYSMDLETFVSSQMGMDMTAFQEKNTESATEQAKIELAYMALAKAEDIDVNDKMMNEVAESEYALYGYASAEDLINEMGEEDYKSHVMRIKVMERLSELVTVVENEPVSLLAQ